MPDKFINITDHLAFAVDPRGAFLLFKSVGEDTEDTLDGADRAAAHSGAEAFQSRYTRSDMSLPRLLLFKNTRIRPSHVHASCANANSVGTAGQGTSSFSTTPARVVFCKNT